MARPRVKHAKRPRIKITKCNACQGPVKSDGMGMSKTLCSKCMCAKCGRAELLCECNYHARESVKKLRDETVQDTIDNMEELKRLMK